MKNTPLTINVLVGVMVMCLAMMVPNLFLPSGIAIGDFGICLPPPAQWPLTPTASWIVNALLLLATGPMLVFFNRESNFVQSPGMIMPISMLLLSCCNNFVASGLCTSTLLLIVNILCLRILFHTYGSTNSTQQYFTVATILSVGSMCQHAFIPMMAGYLLCGVALRSLRAKELMAFLLGIVAPYWVALGLGLRSPADFKWPDFTGMLSIGGNIDLFVMIIGMASIFLISLIICMNNSIRLWAGNTRTRRLNTAINIIGALAALCMLADHHNMLAYVATVNFFIAAQIGNLFALNRVYNPRWVSYPLSLLTLAYCVWTVISRLGESIPLPSFLTL